MIADANAGGLDAVASRWSAIHDALRQAQDDLLHHTLAATDHWTGSAADAFTSRADELHRSLGNGAAYAFNASSGVSCAADALRTAQSTMPPDPDPLEQAATCAATGTCGEPSPLMLQRQREAAAVMDRLEERYRAAGEMIGRPVEYRADTDRGVFPPPPQSQQRPASKLSSAPVHASSRIGKQTTPGENHGGASMASASRMGNEPRSGTNERPPSGTSGIGAVAALEGEKDLAQPISFREPSGDLKFPPSANASNQFASFAPPPAVPANPNADSRATNPEVYNPSYERTSTPNRKDTPKLPGNLEITGRRSLDTHQAEVQLETPESMSNEIIPSNWSTAHGSGASDTPTPATIGGTPVPAPAATMGSLRRRRRPRPNWLAESEETWIPTSACNPAVIE